VKGFLSENGIPYVERDVMEDAAAMQELEELGGDDHPGGAGG